MTEYPEQSRKKVLSERERQQYRETIHVHLQATGEIAKCGNTVEAEVRLKQMLLMAERQFGKDSDEVMLVLSILSAFYRSRNNYFDASVIEGRLKIWFEQAGQLDPSQSEAKEVPAEFESGLAQKLVGKKSDTLRKKAVTNFPQNIRKACKIVGLPPDQELTVDAINRAWKSQMLQSSAHPDLGGNAEEAIILNQAKEALLEFVESLKPKLGSNRKNDKPQ
jgi:hypothetical protein